MPLAMSDGTPDAALRELMRAAQDGDAEAYRALLTAITPRLRRVIRARRAFLNHQDIEDLVQDVLVRCDPADPLCDANYDYASRPEAVKDAVARVSMTGKLRRPLISVQGTLDSLITPATNLDPYVELIEAQHRSRLHRAYLVEGGQHVDGFVPSFGGALRPILPCARAAFDALAAWVESLIGNWC